jgi:hypothetical protein
MLLLLLPAVGGRVRAAGGDAHDGRGPEGVGRVDVLHVLGVCVVCVCAWPINGRRRWKWKRRLERKRGAHTPAKGKTDSPKPRWRGG